MNDGEKCSSGCFICRHAVSVPAKAELCARYAAHRRKIAGFKKGLASGNRYKWPATSNNYTRQSGWQQQ